MEKCVWCSRNMSRMRHHTRTAYATTFCDSLPVCSPHYYYYSNKFIRIRLAPVDFTWHTNEMDDVRFYVAETEPNIQSMPARRIRRCFCFSSENGNTTNFQCVTSVDIKKRKSTTLCWELALHFFIVRISKIADDSNPFQFLPQKQKMHRVEIGINFNFPLHVLHFAKKTTSGNATESFLFGMCCM